MDASSTPQGVISNGENGPITEEWVMARGGYQLLPDSTLKNIYQSQDTVMKAGAVSELRRRGLLTEQGQWVDFGLPPTQTQSTAESLSPTPSPGSSEASTIKIHHDGMGSDQGGDTDLPAPGSTITGGPSTPSGGA